jgi:hypothetical protein
MMAQAEKNEDYVRDRALEAGRWLALIGFRGRPTGPIFSPRLSTYHDMFDPQSDLPRLLAACSQMRKLVGRQIVVEQIAAEELWSQKGELHDPFGLAWRKTERGALLEHVAGLLDDALEADRR